MKTHVLLLLGIATLGNLPTTSFAANSLTETIVMLRHGEKPADGLGQLDCQGLNRSLALPAILRQHFARPAAIFAPNPGRAKKDQSGTYNYVRPLATIEPTAIAYGLPVDTRFGFDDTDQLLDALLAPQYQNATVIVAWEHHQLEDAARTLSKKLGADPASIPAWKSADFDSLYVFRIDTDASGQRRLNFAHERQGLDKLSTQCPDLAP